MARYNGRKRHKKFTKQTTLFGEEQNNEKKPKHTNLTKNSRSRQLKVSTNHKHRKLL